ncbi:hypothetical protein [uncultured Tenacibaculum sp.]|uniref:hypothetical protein n=1 Tax=uncultured Tenacibaculum sp. TaxID=174713 RepID=UPI0026357502|nr:hypothetical protein [uncultured Tenacibaculum sp.]
MSVLRSYRSQIVDDTKMGIPDVHIKNLATQSGTTTNIDGHFNILARETDVLEISHVSIKNFTIQAKDLTGTLTTSFGETLNEVVLDPSKKKKSWLKWLAITAVGTGLLLAFSGSEEEEEEKVKQVIL